jgi:hypothetical protein
MTKFQKMSFLLSRLMLLYAPPAGVKADAQRRFDPVMDGVVCCEAYCNGARLHFALDYVAPDVFNARQLA